ncbi:MAG: D-2-hydroxyacid dehydrogenase [Planctomycetaceae bacterium]|nr:D-2-hydroxyacid dehydrogenase [Planctomycetaceae bacterium]MBP62795.1 D-2-hydroxyacid dehydrogenase [Planctomycetaceae bacterium]
MKLIIHPNVDQQRLQRIREAADEMQVVACSDEATATREIQDADALYGHVTPSMLAAATKLRWIQCPFAGLEHILFPELINHQSVFSNMRGIYSEVITEHVFSLILCFSRNLHLYVRQQAARQWKPIGDLEVEITGTWGQSVVRDADRRCAPVRGATLGVVGLGGIGSEVARRGVAFGMRIVAVDPQPDAACSAIAALWPMDQLSQLLEESDFVVIAAPQTPATVGLFGKEQFQQMKSTAFLINIGRGAIVHLDDLVNALETGQIAGAGLDVFEQEPLPPEHPLWQLENVVITPHVAAVSVQVAEGHMQVVTENIRRFSQGKELLNVVDKRRWY